MKKSTKKLLSALVASVTAFTSISCAPALADENNGQETNTAYTQTAADADVITSDTIIVQPVSPNAAVQGEENIIDYDTYIGKEITVNLDLKNVENTDGINNYTFFVTYNPDVVRMTGAASPDIENIDSLVTYPITIGNLQVDATIYDEYAIKDAVAFTPAAHEDNYEDYADVITPDTSPETTCGELGKVKLTDYIGDTDNEGNLITATKSGTLIPLTFEVIGYGDTEIAVDLTYPTIDGFRAGPINPEPIKSVALPSNIYVDDANAPVYSDDTILVQPVSPNAVSYNRHNVIDYDTYIGKELNVNIYLANF